MTVINVESTILRLTTAVDRLRTEQRALIHANGQLLAWGIGSATEEIHDRLHAIANEAHTIAARLHALGAYDEALDALTGWAIVAELTTPKGRAA